MMNYYVKVSQLSLVFWCISFLLKMLTFLVLFSCIGKFNHSVNFNTEFY